MKILYVISDRNIGGAGVLLCTLLRNLNRQSFRCAVALPFGSELRKPILNMKIPVYELAEPCDRYSVRSVCELKHIIYDFSPDIVHANAAVSARIAGKLCGKKVVHTRHCYFPLKKNSNHWLRMAENFGNRIFSDHVIATAEAAAENLVLLGIPRKKISVIPNGSEEIREITEQERAKVLEKLQLEPDDFCVGICARLEPCKGHKTFLDAAQLAIQKMPECRFRFLIVGTGSRRKQLEELVRQKGLSDVVRFTGFVRDMALIYRILRINVNCSCGTETSCLAISEGMSASLPTIASNYGGNRAMLGSGGAGICFPVGNAQALADAICEIASDSNLEFRMRSAARNRYLERYTAARMTHAVEKVYRSLV